MTKVFPLIKPHGNVEKFTLRAEEVLGIFFYTWLYRMFLYMTLTITKKEIDFLGIYIYCGAFLRRVTACLHWLMVLYIVDEITNLLPRSVFA